MNLQRILLSTLLLGSLALGATSAASAYPHHIANHPRVNEVNGRLNHQQARINQGLRSGHLNRWQAHRLERGDHRIFREEQRMRAADGGHLTRRDDRILNRQLNRESGTIWRDKHE